MRVLHLGKYYPPIAGGIENFLGDLLPALLRQNIDAHAVVHRFPGKAVKAGAARLDDARVTQVPCYGTLLYAPISPGFPCQLYRTVRRLQPDIIHLHLPNTSAFWVMLPLSRLRVPWVVHWHADVIASKIDRRMAAAYAFYRPFEQRLLARSALIIATSRPYLASSTPLGDWQNKCTVIPLGIDLTRLPIPHHSAMQWAENLWERSNALRIVAVGRLTYYKGHEIVIRAAAANKNVQVIVVGEGDRRLVLDKLISDLQVADRVTLTGHLPDAQLHALLASSHGLCLPSIERTEAFGLVLLEAMRYRLPVIASDVPGSGIGWVVKNQETGYLFPTGSVDALAALFNRLAAGPESLPAMGDAGYQRLQQQCAIDIVAGKIIQQYEKLLNLPSPRKRSSG